MLQYFTFTDTMSFGRYILLFIALYVGYKLVFGLILPVLRTTRQVRRQFRQMNEQMQQQANTGQNNRPDARVQPKQPARASKPEAGDYIDFEEIK